MQHVQVKRLVLCEQDRVGIGTFQPKDEKNQDSTELTGDINYRKIAEYGSDSDPRAFNFDGEFNIANRGIIEFVEILKLDVAFLYDLLGATQEHKIKPKKFAQTDIDEVIIGHTNEPEYKKLLNNEFMEALRDRTVKIDIPYITKLSEEVKIYEKDFNIEEGRQARRAAHARRGRDVGGAHAPRGAEEAQPVAAAEGQAVRRQDAARLHRGQHQGAAQGGHRARAWTASRRATSRTRSPTRWSATRRDGAINPFMVLNELESGPAAPLADLQRGASASATASCCRVVKQEYEDIVKNEVQRAISRRRGRDRQALRQLHRQRQGLHPEGEGQEPVHRPGRGAGRAPDALDRGEDRHPREPQGRLPPRDHELHRRAGGRGPAVRLQDQRAPAQGARARSCSRIRRTRSSSRRSSPTSSTATRRRRSTSSSSA